MRLRRQITGAPKANGTVTLRYPAVPVGRVWTGTVAIPSSDPTAIWEITIADQVWANLLGPGPFGPLQAVDGEQIVLDGTGLTPGAQQTAILIGADDVEGQEANYTGPGPLPSPSAPTIVTIAGGLVDVEVDGPIATDLFLPNAAPGTVTCPANTQTVILDVGHWKVWGMDCVGTNGTGLTWLKIQVEDGYKYYEIGSMFMDDTAPATKLNDHVDLNGIEINGSHLFIFNGGSADAHVNVRARAL